MDPECWNRSWRALFDKPGWNEIQKINEIAVLMIYLFTRKIWKNPKHLIAINSSRWFKPNTFISEINLSNNYFDILNVLCIRWLFPFNTSFIHMLPVKIEVCLGCLFKCVEEYQCAIAINIFFFRRNECSRCKRIIPSWSIILQSAVVSKSQESDVRWHPNSAGTFSRKFRTQNFLSMATKNSQGNSGGPTEFCRWLPNEPFELFD